MKVIAEKGVQNLSISGRVGYGIAKLQLVDKLAGFVWSVEPFFFRFRGVAVLAS